MAALYRQYRRRFGRACAVGRVSIITPQLCHHSIISSGESRMADLTSVILDHERRRCEATVAGDAEALGKLFNDRLRYVHSNALVDGKSDYLANIANPDV